MTQAITTQAQAATTQAQSMTTQANQEFVPRANEQVATISSIQRDFTRMNTPTIYGSNMKNTPTSSLMKSSISSML